MNSSGVSGPLYDRFEKTDGHFVNVHADMTQTHSETALLYSSYFDAKERDRVCFHFWYSLQHSFAVDSVSVDVTRDSIHLIIVQHDVKYLSEYFCNF